jgi:hypothetical protein
MSTKPKMVDVPDDELQEQIAIGMHTGLRKGSEAPSSGPLWRAINDSNDGAWSDAAAFTVYGLRAMGYKITKEAQA